MLVEEVKRILSELSGEEKIENDSSLQDDLMLDSLAMVTLLINIEEAFNIELDESDMNPLEMIVVQDLIDMINKYLVKKNEKNN